MKYKCLVLDHDDTVVESTKTIHYPAFVEILNILRPKEKITLEDYFIKNFEYGFIELCKTFYSFSDEELRFEADYWKNFAKDKIPNVYPGMKELLWEHKKNGGIICVVSFSFCENIICDYENNGLPLPDIIFGFEEPKERRKPSPYPIEEIIKKYDLKKEDIFVIDDAMHGLEMAKNAGVEYAFAGWAHNISKINESIEKNVPLSFKTVDEFKNYIK